MKHIVKFNQASDANNYEIKNVPFLTTVGENNQLLTCNEENKKIVIDSQGNASIVDAGPELISFTIDRDYQAEEGMTWREWIESDYNTNGYYLSDTFMAGVTVITRDSEYYVGYYDSYGYPVSPDEEITNNEIYWEDNSPF